MRPLDERGPQAAARKRSTRVDLRLPLVDAGRALPWRAKPLSVAREVASTTIVEVARSIAERRGDFVLGGGDPLERADLAEVLSELARLRPDDLGLALPGDGLDASRAGGLAELGVKRLHIPFYCARQDAHDWLFGRPGALKTAHRAIRACVRADLPVTAEVVLTRPTVAHLAETIAVLDRLKVRRVCLRRLIQLDTEGAEFVPLSVRLGALRESLEKAAALALERRMEVVLRDLPLCAAPRLRPLFAQYDSELWVATDGTCATRMTPSTGCEECPGPPQCSGAPADYVARFGWQELVEGESHTPRIAETVVDQQTTMGSGPMAFSWRGPHRVRCEGCADPVESESASQPAYESTRAVRARLVEASRYRPSHLRLVGADLLAHPDAASLIYDAVRLFRHVEVAGEASAAVDWADLDLRRLKDVKRFDVAIYGPDAASHDAHCGIPGAYAATLRAVERLREQAEIEVGAYAILHDAGWVAAFAQAWQAGELPGEPRFRLSANGSALDDLVECARDLAAGKTRTALLSVLPRCLCDKRGLVVTVDEARDLLVHGDVTKHQMIYSGRTTSYHPCGSDPLGAFEMCRDDGEPCDASGCPGTAVGWQNTARSKQWSGSI